MGEVSSIVSLTKQQIAVYKMAQKPTPVASDYEGGVCKDAKVENGRWLRTNAKGQKFGVKVRDAVGATGIKTGEKLRLQPAMPEWMMGFPEKWTEFPIASPSGGTNQSKPTATQ